MVFCKGTARALTRADLSADRQAQGLPLHLCRCSFFLPIRQKYAIFPNGHVWNIQASFLFLSYVFPFCKNSSKKVLLEIIVMQ